MRPIKLVVREFGPYAGEQLFDFAALDGRSFFLIHGPTGAGKTSILDAICFALYGQASGSRDPRQMRSDHAKIDSPTEVEFDFSIGVERYRIRRRPTQERPRKRGTGTVVEEASATLWRRTGLNGHDADDGVVLEEGAAKVGEHVERLLGFKVDQFRQVVMLPQGMFQRLLMASSKDREEILEALFAVEAYGRVEAVLKGAAAGMRQEREKAATLRAETLRAAGVEGREALVARRGELDGARAGAIVEREGLRVAKRAAQEALAAGRAVAEKIREREEAKKTLAGLEGQREAYVLKQGRHERACKALQLVQFEEEVLRRNGEAKRAAEKLEAARKAVEVAGAAKVKADAALVAEEAKEPQREAARALVARLEQLGEKVRELAGAAGAEAAAREKVKGAQSERAEAERSVVAARAAVEAAEKRKGELEAAAGQLEAIQLRHNRTGMELNTRRKLEEERKARGEAAGRVERLKKKELPKLEQTLAWARQTLEEMQGRWDRGQAAMLARSLKAGEACPVCGSTEHPLPAHAAEELPSEEKLNGARAQVERLAKDHAELRAELAKEEEGLRNVESHVAQLEDALGMRIGQTVDALAAELKVLEEQRQNAEAAGLELDKAKRGVEAAKTQLEGAEKRVAAAEGAVNEAVSAQCAAQAVLAEREAAVPEALRQPAALEREREAAARQRKGLEDALAAARKAAEEARTAAARAGADLTSAGELAEASAALFESLRREFSEKAQQAGFADHAAFKAARLSQAEADALDQEIRAYHVALGTARERLERAEGAAKDLVAADVAKLEADDAAAQKALEAKINAVAQLGQQVESIDKAVARLNELEQRLAELDERYRVVGAMAEVANGQNPYRMTFQRYVLGVFLDEVLHQATQRLRTMSRGRFLLQRVAEAVEDRRTLGGLELQVHDTHTSTVRPVSTLSGGESFIASLSLALGLADVVQGYAGGIRLETIFVDEGFGTLDPESLDLAIRALRDLQKGGRLVGIISHVTELKEWIDARLEVVAGRRGSVARFVVG